MPSRDVFVVSTARTAIGTFGGCLKDVPNTQLATTAVKAAIARAGIAADAVGNVVMGNVIPTDTRDAYLSRVAAIDAGCKEVILPKDNERDVAMMPDYLRHKVSVSYVGSIQEVLAIALLEK